MKDIGLSIIFCQSSVKVTATLNCYESEKRIGNDVIIVVRNARAVYDFLKSLKVDAQIFWFNNHLKTYYGIPDLLTLRKGIKNDIKQLPIKGRKIVHVYFTSICNDLSMGCYLKKFNRNVIVKLQGHLDISNGIDTYDISSGSFPLIIRAKRTLYSLLLGYRIRIQNVVVPTLALDLGFYRYKFFDGSDMEICKKYKYVIPEVRERKAIVFASDYEDIFLDRNRYVKTFVDCINVLQEKGFYVAIKGHPRIGTLKEASIVADKEIPTYIPAEFLDYKDFNLAIGLITTAICSTSDAIKSYSLLPLSYLVNDKRYSGWCDYLDKTSGGKVLYLKSFDDIK